MTRRTHAHSLEVRLQRAYEDPGADDGYRVLVDRFWPRGRAKDILRLDEWARDLAPEPELIKWFGHKPERWQEFRRRYREWLDTPQQAERLSALLEATGARVITLVYGARSETENQAVVIRDALVHAARK